MFQRVDYIAGFLVFRFTVQGAYLKSVFQAGISMSATFDYPHLSSLYHLIREVAKTTGPPDRIGWRPHSMGWQMAARGPTGGSATHTG